MNYFDETLEWENINSANADDDNYWRFDAGSHTSKGSMSCDERLSKLNQAKRILSSLQHPSGKICSTDEDLQQVLNIVIDTISELVVGEDNNKSSFGNGSKSMPPSWFPPVPQTVVTKTSSGSAPKGTPTEKYVHIPQPKHRRTDTASTVPETVASSTASSPRSSHRKVIKPIHFIEHRFNDFGDDQEQHCYPSKSYSVDGGQRNKPEDIFDLWYNDVLSKDNDQEVIVDQLLFHEDEEKIGRLWSQPPTTSTKKLTPASLSRTKSLPPPPPPLTTPRVMNHKSTGRRKEASLPGPLEKESVPCSVDIYIDQEDDCCSLLYVDMDDFDDYTIDEVELSRELAGYHEGCEPKIVDVVPCVFEADAKAAMSLSRRMLMSSSARRRTGPPRTVSKTITTPSTSRSSGKGLARFVIAARPTMTTSEATSKRRQFFLSRRLKEPTRPALALAAKAAVSTPTCSVVEEDSHSACSCGSRCRFCRGTMCCI